MTKKSLLKIKPVTVNFISLCLGGRVEENNYQWLNLNEKL